MYPKKKFDSASRFGQKRDFVKSALFSATCVQCGNECQVPFKPMGNRPVYCRDCFKAQDEGGFAPKKWEKRGVDDKLMYPAECDECHSECKVPFKPIPGRPIFCHRCKAAQTGGPARESFASSNSFNAPNASAAGSKMSDDQFKILNAKLDKILKILELATADVDEEMDEDEEELEDIVEEKPAAKKKTRGQTKRAKRTGKA